MYAYEHGVSPEEVRQWMDRQQERYEKNGFGIVGRRKHYYSAPEEDALCRVIPGTA